MEPTQIWPFSSKYNFKVAMPSILGNYQRNKYKYGSPRVNKTFKGFAIYFGNQPSVSNFLVYQSLSMTYNVSPQNIFKLKDIEIVVHHW